MSDFRKILEKELVMGILQKEVGHPNDKLMDRYDEIANSIRYRRGMR